MTRTLSKVLQALLGLMITALVLWLGLTHGMGRAHDRSIAIEPGQSLVELSNFDGDGHPLVQSYKVPPERVLVTYPGATELLIALGLEDRIVGTVKPYGVEPADLAGPYGQLPILEAPFVPSKEEALAYEPDLIIGWNHHFLPGALGQVGHWQRQGIATYIVPATVRRGKPSLQGILYPFIDDMGKIFGEESRAEAYKQGLDERIKAVESKAKQKAYKPSVMILQSYGNSTYTAYGENYVIQDIVEKAGGRPLVPQGMTAVGPERILAYDPDYIVLVMSDEDGDREAFTRKGKELLEKDSKLRHMSAIMSGRIIPVPFSSVNNGNGRLVEALEWIGAGLVQ